MAWLCKSHYIGMLLNCVSKTALHQQRLLFGLILVVLTAALPSHFFCQETQRKTSVAMSTR